jgi:hypothetical protein
VNPRAPVRRVRRARGLPVRRISPGTTAPRTPRSRRQQALPTTLLPPRSRARSPRPQTARARSRVRAVHRALRRPSNTNRRSRPNRSRRLGRPRNRSRDRRRRLNHNGNPRPAAKLRARPLKRSLVLHLRRRRALRMHRRPLAPYPYGTRLSLQHPRDHSSRVWDLERRPSKLRETRLLRLHCRLRLRRRSRRQPHQVVQPRRSFSPVQSLRPDRRLVRRRSSSARRPTSSLELQPVRGPRWPPVWPRQQRPRSGRRRRPHSQAHLRGRHDRARRPVVCLLPKVVHPRHRWSLLLDRKHGCRQDRRIPRRAYQGHQRSL